MFHMSCSLGETPYELALYLHLVRHGLFPRWPEVFSLAESVLESLSQMDEELFLHLKEVSVINPNLDTKVTNPTYPTFSILLIFENF